MTFLHEEVRIIHTDLKPENILFARSDYTVITDITKAPANISKKANPKEKFSLRVPCDYKVKIIDFGGAIYFKEAHDGLINTRQYRSPEVILGSKTWNEKTDVWSLACIFIELYTGELLFQTHSDKEHLSMIWRNSSKNFIVINLAKEQGFPEWMVNFSRYQEAFSSSKYNPSSKVFNLDCLDDKEYQNYKEFIPLQVS